MAIAIAQKQISNEERMQIKQQVRAELVEHLYKGCLPGTVAGVPVGIAYFFVFYGHTTTSLLIAWSIYYFLTLINLGALYFVFQKYRRQFSLTTWLWAYSVAMSLCALAWGISSFLIPTDSIFREYVAIIALLIFANGYAAGTIGVLELCVATLSIIMLPLTIRCFLQEGPLHQLIGVFTFIYYMFLIGINRRSTEWFKDSLRLKLENTLVSYQANHDLLTGLPNQRLLPQYVEALAIEYQANSDTFALACLSLNRMEMVEDSLGHHAGNEIIQSVATRLKDLAKIISKNDDTQYIVTISRKDTFNVLVAPCNESNVASKLNKLFAVLDEPFYLEKQAVKMTACIGVCFPKEGKIDVEELMMCADAAMLKAKYTGGNRLEFYRPEINEQLPKQLEIETDLHEALDKQQLQLYYQPLIDIKTGLPCGMEALIRWPHPTQGFISPMRFIPLAEQTGLIIPIGEWILREACTQTKKWHQMGFSSLKVAVNLSEKQLRHENLVEMVKQVLAETKLDANFLELEITETAMLEDSVTSIIKEFNGMGIRLAVDDFGTGYSGLSYLQRFSVDKLKIDQSFIRDIPESNNSMTIVSAIIAMAKELQIHTLAEGVETIEQLQFLQTRGCDYIQGYYFSKPLEKDQFTQFLHSSCKKEEIV